MFTIPGATLLFSRGNYSLAASVKKLVAYFPLFMAFNILLFEAVAFYINTIRKQYQSS